jgi:hypothetical protein
MQENGRMIEYWNGRWRTTNQETWGWDERRTMKRKITDRRDGHSEGAAAHGRYGFVYFLGQKNLRLFKECNKNKLNQ